MWKNIDKTNQSLTTSYILTTLCLIIFYLFPILALAENSSSPPAEYQPTYTVNSLSSMDNMPMALAPEGVQNIKADVLLIQTALPWNSNANTEILSSLGYTYEVTDFSGLANHNLWDYQIVLIVNDQIQAFYDAYAANYQIFEDYVKSGGTLVFFACDHGWAGGNNYTNLPGGIQVGDLYDSFNYIADGASTHPIITGSLRTNGTIRTKLTDADLEGTYASHNYFIENTLPTGSDIIFRSSQTNAPTLVRYQLDKGYVIASGLTWEFTYDRYQGDGVRYGFGRALPDVFLYAFSIAAQTAQPLSVYPDDNRLARARPKTIKNPGDMLDIVANIDGSKQIDIGNGTAFSLSFSIRSDLIDIDAPILVYERENHASVVEEKEIEINSPIIQREAGITIVTVNDLTLNEATKEWFLRVKLASTFQTREIDATVDLKVNNKVYSEKLSSQGAVFATANTKIILTNREALYKQFVDNGQGGIDATQANQMNKLWEAVYQEAGEVFASVIFVGKFDLNYDEENDNAILAWPTTRLNLPFDQDTSKGDEENDINEAANLIRTYLIDRVNASGGIGNGRYVVILGGDSVIPFCRSYDVTGTVLNTAADFPLAPEFYASNVFRTDGENGYLHTDGCYRSMVLNDTWKGGTADNIYLGRVTGTSITNIKNLWISSARRLSVSENVVLLENHARDEELRTYENQAIAAGFNIVNSVNNVTLDEEPVSCSLYQRLLNQCPQQTDDDAGSATLTALFSGTSDVNNFDIWRGMTHGSVEAIQSSENWYHEYTSGQLLNNSSNKISNHFEDFRPIFVFDACLIGQVDGNDGDDLFNRLLGLNVGGVAGSSVVTYSFLPSDISQYNDRATESLFQGNSIGEAYTNAFRNFTISLTKKDDLHRQAVNVFGLPWAKVSVPTPGSNPTAAAGSLLVAQNGLQIESVQPAMNLITNNVIERRIAFSTGIYQIHHDDSKGFDLVDVNEFSPLLQNTETPVLVFKTETALLPPDAEIVGVNMIVHESVDLGALNIPGFQRGLGLPGGSLGELVPLENALGIYPRQMVEYDLGEQGDNKMLNLVYYPLSFNADTGHATLVSSGELVIQYQTNFKGVGNYLVTDKTSYTIGEPIIATVSITNVSVAEENFTLNSTLYDLKNNVIASGTDSSVITGGASGSINVELASPTQSGMYKLISIVRDGSGKDIATFEKEIFVISGGIQKFIAQDRFMQDEEGWFTLGFMNYRNDDMELTANIDIFKANGDLVAQLPQIIFKVSGGETKQVQEAWIPSSALTNGQYYATLILLEDGQQRHTAKTEMFSVGETLNEPPVADAGIDQTQECTSVNGAVVVFDGSNSYDPEGNPLTFTWSGPFGELNGEKVAATLPIGSHVITLTVDDGNGSGASDMVTVTVVDTVAPNLEISLSPDILWPPNHKMVEISSTVNVSDVCDANPTVTLSSVNMNEGDVTNTYDPEYDMSQDDGKTLGDIILDQEGNISLRAERSGTSDGRIYTIEYLATDKSGNQTRSKAQVTVPHNQ